MPLSFNDVATRIQYRGPFALEAWLADESRVWLAKELLRVPCRCPVCNRRTDLSLVPDVQKTIAETVAYSDTDRQKALAVILEGYLPKLATMEVREGQFAFMVFCGTCTLADLHRKSNPSRIDHYKQQPRPGRARFFRH